MYIILQRLYDSDKSRNSLIEKEIGCKRNMAKWKKTVESKTAVNSVK